MVTADRPQVTITMPPLHAGQVPVQRSKARFRVVCCGRRWGKTLLGTSLLFEEALKGGRCWWVAPSYKEALEGWRYLLVLVNQLPKGIARIHTADLMVSFTSGGEVQVRTGREPDELRGAGLDAVVIDEAATIKEDAWALALRPALSDRRGWAMFIGTPKHYNHFYGWFERGQDPEEQDWESWQFPTWTNPHIAPEEIEAAQRDMEPEDFAQEYGASFTAVGGAIFPLLASNRPMYLRPMPPGTIEQFRRAGVGMDWGTTKEHQASVVGGGVLSTGVVWITHAWLSDSGSSNEWNDEAARIKPLINAEFARVDRSQSSNLDPIKARGFSADTGLANVEARIGMMQGLVRKQAIYFDSNDPGVRELYRHLCAYHRIPEGQPKAGQPEEVEDDDVDACCYLVAELVQPRDPLPNHVRAAGMMRGNNARRWEQWN